MRGDRVLRYAHRQTLARWRSLRQPANSRRDAAPALAVDARVIAQDTRGIGRYARAILRRLVTRDDVELTLLADPPFPFRQRSAYALALGEPRSAIVRGSTARSTSCGIPQTARSLPRRRRAS